MLPGPGPLPCEDWAAGVPGTRRGLTHGPVIDRLYQVIQETADLWRPWVGIALPADDEAMSAAIAEVVATFGGRFTVARVDA